MHILVPLAGVRHDFVAAAVDSPGTPPDWSLEAFGLAFAGTTSSSYRGTDATVNVGVYSQATRINRILGAGQSLDLDFTLYIAPAQQTLIRQAEQANNPTWLADTGFWLVFPNVVEEDLIRLKVEFEP